MKALNVQKATARHKYVVFDTPGFYSSLLEGDGLAPVPVGPSAEAQRIAQDRAKFVQRVETLAGGPAQVATQRPPPGLVLSDEAVADAVGRSADALMITVREAAAILGVSPITIHNWFFKCPGRYPRVIVKNSHRWGGRADRGRVKMPVSTLKRLFEDSIKDYRGGICIE